MLSYGCKNEMCEQVKKKKKHIKASRVYKKIEIKIRTMG